MTALTLRLEADGRHTALALPRRRPERIGEILLRTGGVAPDRLRLALALQDGDRRRLGDILVSRRWATPEAIAAAVAVQRGVAEADFEAHPPDPSLVDGLGATACLRLGVLPWRHCGAVAGVAVADLDTARDHRAEIETALGPVRFALAPRHRIEETLLTLRRATLVRQAEHRVPAAESLRGMGMRLRTAALAAVGIITLAAALAPVTTLALATAWAVLAMLTTSSLRAAATLVQLFHAHVRGTRFTSVHGASPDETLPIVSILVPLYREREIASRLVDRLARLDYPEDRLDICLVVEADDHTTQDTLASVKLPPAMRSIVVPGGTVRTKPRALNYALDFCRGSIVGVYDAEDAPAPDQLRRVVRRFRESPPEVACLQGVLDFYNARTNWLSRCFAIDYATWFRIVLPGIARLGLVIPLGGTTLFFRRAALERLGGWDAHNVTEDADLGIRLARHGYRCELIDSVTEEEANCRAIPWIRQRSRWLKGYALTWISHMRRPALLLRDLGWWRFAGVQILFLGTLSTFLFAPFVWSFWLLPFGLPHPLAGLVPWWLFVALGTVFLFTELVNIAAGALGVSSAKHRWLIPWVPTMHFYHPLGALASWKALAEVVLRPFYWDKTAHGLYGPEAGTIPREQPVRRRGGGVFRRRSRYAP